MTYSTNYRADYLTLLYFKFKMIQKMKYGTVFVVKFVAGYNLNFKGYCSLYTGNHVYPTTI